jgi:ABC-type uncharacterized transport system auxiliary subunit
MTRTRKIAQLTAVFFFAGIAAACSASRPVKYYVLDTPATPTAAAPTQFPVTLVVARITTSHLYRDNRLVYGSGPVQLGTYEYERWSESPADMIQDMVVSSLRATGQYRAVSRVGSVTRGDFIVRGHLDALDEIDKPSLAGRFSFRIELFDSKSGTVVWSRSYSHDEPVQGKRVSDVVEALDRNVQAGMQQLTAGLAQYFANPPAQ